MRETAEDRGCDCPPCRGQRWRSEWHGGRSWTTSFFPPGWLYWWRLGRGRRERASTVRKMPGVSSSGSWGGGHSVCPSRRCLGWRGWQMVWGRFLRKPWKWPRESWHLSICHDEGPQTAPADTTETVLCLQRVLFLLSLSWRAHWGGGKKVIREQRDTLRLPCGFSNLSQGWTVEKSGRYWNSGIRLDWLFNIQNGRLTDTWKAVGFFQTSSHFGKETWKQEIMVG